MRITSLLRTLLGLEGTRVFDVNFDEFGLGSDVATRSLFGVRRALPRIRP